jgi:hypothetical protein
MTGDAGQTGIHWGSVVWGYYKSAGWLPFPNGGSGKSLISCLAIRLFVTIIYEM